MERHTRVRMQQLDCSHYAWTLILIFCFCFVQIYKQETTRRTTEHNQTPVCISLQWVSLHKQYLHIILLQFVFMLFKVNLVSDLDFKKVLSFAQFLLGVRTAVLYDQKSHFCFFSPENKMPQGLLDAWRGRKPSKRSQPDDTIIRYLNCFNQLILMQRSSDFELLPQDLTSHVHPRFRIHSTFVQTG